MPKGVKGFQKGHEWFGDEETKKKIAETLREIGAPWLIGKKKTKEHRKKLSIARKGKTRPKFSKQWIENMSKAHKNQVSYWKGKKRPEISGKNHPLWKGGYENTLMLHRKRRIMKKGNGGSHTLGGWETLKAQYNWTCPCCGVSEPTIQLTEDHIIPISKGGSNNIENIQPLCGSCNRRKQTKIIKYDIKKEYCNG